MEYVVAKPRKEAPKRTKTRRVLIVIRNDRLLELSPGVSITRAFELVDNVLVGASAEFLTSSPFLA